MGGCEPGGQQVAWATTGDASIETEGVESIRARAPPCLDQRSLCIRADGKARHSWDISGSSATQLYPHVSN